MSSVSGTDTPVFEDLGVGVCRYRFPGGRPRGETPSVQVGRDGPHR